MSKADPEIEALFDKAKELVRHYDKVAASLLQRAFSLNFAQVTKLMELLEKKGVLGPADGYKARDVLQDKIAKKS